jgi:hypothetical protein
MRLGRAVLRAGVLVVSLAALVATARAQPPARPRLDIKALDAQVKALLDEHGDGVSAGVWVGGPSGGPWYAREADAVQSTASAIKTSYLVELFARYADTLDRPPPGLDDVLRDGHPALAPYPPSQRDEIRRALSAASVRKLGGVMMGSEPAPNHVYNAAASAVTALFGGPEGLTRAIRARDPAFAPIVARRYMLAPRDVTGDNEATAAALAAVLQRLAARTVPGVDGAAVEALRGTVLVKEDYLGLKGRHHVKTGELNSDPLTRVQSGWWDVDAPGLGPVVYCVMLTQPSPAGRPRDEAGTRLAKTGERLTRAVLDAARGAARGE